MVRAVGASARFGARQFAANRCVDEVVWRPRVHSGLGAFGYNALRRSTAAPHLTAPRRAVAAAVRGRRVFRR
eukprot:364250-Chlamydomonas_euryale.AAC.8